LESYVSIPPKHLNIASMTVARDVLGPGNRFILWVRGCLRHCTGCIAPQWRAMEQANLIETDSLINFVSKMAIDGITISGGEPALQAAELARFLRGVQSSRREKLNVIAFSGYTLDELKTNPPGTGADDFLSELDVLIDGEYILALDNGVGLRGSANQTIHHLNQKRLAHIDFANQPRSIEIRILEGETMMIGIPTKEDLRVYHRGINAAIRKGGV